MSQDLSLKPSFRVGKYRHYKGNEYELVDLVRHSETEEWMVLYRPLYGDADLWVRPYDMFFEKVTLNSDQLVDRFEKL
ncbi:DUF1653 domain-containing protein [Neptunomonas japonica]|uniref:DUF1653 domain-containing protein n=1 Tax=Neptunomonas japonica TaxID=417574 RepID=UPI0003FA27E9|nr:DUF1653 domain-containing protein [Neptunomonas japonica]